MYGELVNFNQLLGFTAVWIGLIIYCYALIKEK